METGDLKCSCTRCSSFSSASKNPPHLSRGIDEWKWAASASLPEELWPGRR